MHKIGMGGAMAARNRNTILAGGGGKQVCRKLGKEWHFVELTALKLAFWQSPILRTCFSE